MCLNKLNLNIPLWVSHLVNHLKMLKILRRETVTKFYRFYKVYDEFQEISLDSKYNSRHVTRRGGDLPCPSSKIGKKCPDLWKKIPDCGHLWVKFSFKMQFLRVSRRKNRRFFPCGTFLSCVVGECLSKCPVSKKTPLP